MAKATGGCFCGEVRYEIDLPSIFCGHCHCSMCRRAHGASYVTWVGVPWSQFRVTAGEPVVATFESSTHGRRRFCSRCGTQICCVHLGEQEGVPQYVAVTRATLYDEVDRAPEAHFHFDSRAPWTQVNDDLPKLGGKSGTEPLEET